MRTSASSGRIAGPLGASSLMHRATSYCQRGRGWLTTGMRSAASGSLWSASNGQSVSAMVACLHASWLAEYGAADRLGGLPSSHGLMRGLTPPGTQGGQGACADRPRLMDTGSVGAFLGKAQGRIRVAVVVLIGHRSSFPASERRFIGVRALPDGDHWTASQSRQIHS